MAGSVAEIVKAGVFHGAIKDIFKGYTLYRHQLEAIKLGTSGQDFVVTSGTGSGKSLTYIGSIFHHLLTSRRSPGVVAVVVYPMNALINSQTNEFKIYKENYEKGTGKEFPNCVGVTKDYRWSQWKIERQYDHP
jgi:superfamily II DNA/RNA helicase